jgi:hypothetical protein
MDWDFLVTDVSAGGPGSLEDPRVCFFTNCSTFSASLANKTNRATMVEDRLNYRTAFAANNAGVAMLRKGLSAEALPIFRRAASLIRLESPIRSLLEASCVVDSPCTANPFQTVHMSSFCPTIQCMEEEDLELMGKLLNVSEVTNMLAINVREIPREDDHCAMEFQFALIFYNYALASLLCYHHHDDGGDQNAASSNNRASLMSASKALFGLAREIMIRRIRHGNVCLSAKSLHLTSLVLSGLSEISRLQNDVQSTLRFMHCQRLLESYFEEVVYFGMCTNSISAAVA